MNEKRHKRGTDASDLYIIYALKGHLDCFVIFDTAHQYQLLPELLAKLDSSLRKQKKK